MLETLRYVNHINEELKFGTGGVFVNYNELHDYLWKYQVRGDKISYLYRGVVEKVVPVVIACQDPDRGIQIINQLMEYTERDILVKSPGRIYIGEYYLDCYVIGSTKGDYLAKRGYLRAELRVLTDQAAWIKETKFTFSNSSGGGQAGGQGLDYNFDYPIDYMNPYTSRTVNNTGFVGSDFRMVIYGPCENPHVAVGEHAYEVDCGEIAAHEYLTIDSKKKTIILTHANGSKTNVFKYRYRDSYIFEKMPSGETQVTWDGNMIFDITLYEERSEPKWTETVPSSAGNQDSPGAGKYVAGPGIDITANVISVKSSVLNEISDATAAIGTLQNLTTDDKSNLVGAVNEVNEPGIYVDEDGYLCQKT